MRWEQSTSILQPTDPLRRLGTWTPHSLWPWLASLRSLAEYPGLLANKLPRDSSALCNQRSCHHLQWVGPKQSLALIRPACLQEHDALLRAIVISTFGGDCSRSDWCPGRKLQRRGRVASAAKEDSNMEDSIGALYMMPPKIIKYNLLFIDFGQSLES